MTNAQLTNSIEFIDEPFACKGQNPCSSVCSTLFTGSDIRHVITILEGRRDNSTKSIMIVTSMGFYIEVHGFTIFRSRTCKEISAVAVNVGNSIPIFCRFSWFNFVAATPVFSRHVVANFQRDTASVVIRKPLIDSIRKRFARGKFNAFFVPTYITNSFGCGQR